jgi:hypothetical protein
MKNNLRQEVFFIFLEMLLGCYLNSHDGFLLHFLFEV